MKSKAILTFLLGFTLIMPNLVEARGFSGGSHSFSSHSSSRSSFSSTRSSTSSSKVSLSKSSTRKSPSTKASSSKSTTTKSKSFSGSTSTKTTKPKGSVSGKTSNVKGKTYTSKTTRTFYNGRSVSVNHYYHAGYSPYGWFGYYNGFTTGMFMGSMYHPWGHTYYVGGHYTTYGPSPLAWIADVIALIILLVIIIAIYRTVSPRKVVYRR